MTAKIDQAAAASATLKAKVQQLRGELAELTKSQAVMDNIRREEHALFLETKTDLELGLEDVRKVIGMLREYYGSAEVTYMLQAGAAQPPVPENLSKAASAGSSIIGMLEVVESDFGGGLGASPSRSRTRNGGNGARLRCRGSRRP